MQASRSGSPMSLSIIIVSRSRNRHVCAGTSITRRPSHRVIFYIPVLVWYNNVIQKVWRKKRQPRRQRKTRRTVGQLFFWIIFSRASSLSSMGRSRVFTRRRAPSPQRWGGGPFFSPFRFSWPHIPFGRIGWAPGGSLLIPRFRGSEWRDFYFFPFPRLLGKAA